MAARPHSVPLATALLLAAWLCGPAVHAQAAIAPAPDAAAAARQSAARKPDARPAWAELTAQQQSALRPLAGSWAGMTEPHKRKWIALSSNFHAMQPAEQATLHSRMAEWAALSPQQRAQARLNFAEAKDLPAADRKAKWEAYKALSDEEKRKLASDGPPRTSPTAAGIRPIPPQKLASVPRSPGDPKPPRIASVPAGGAHPAGAQH